MPFRSENAFAQGRPRRPRRSPGSDHRPVPMTFTMPSSLMSVSPSTSVELRAFHYWVENFTAQRTDVIDMKDDYGTYALSRWNHTRPGSSLHLAVSAFSLASIIKMRTEIKELSRETIDQLLVAIKLMGGYDNVMYLGKRQITQPLPPSTVDDAGPPIWNNISHYKGAAGLLQIRQEQGYPQNVPLDRAVRFFIKIRACILRGETVQGWLQNGAAYGEEGPALTLDSLTVQVAALRSRSVTLFHETDPDLPSRINRLEDIAIEARELDLALAAWTHAIPDEWKFSIHPSTEPTKSDVQYEGHIHRYTTHEHAAIWIHYRAVRIIVNSILLRLLSALAECARPESSLTAQLGMCQEKIISLATDLCRTVPCFFLSDHKIDASGSKPTERGDYIASTEGNISQRWQFS
ncbi:hypothetical protein V1509DRAFT_671592 [Lipomyces kononenkoae]